MSYAFEKALQRIHEEIPLEAYAGEVTELHRSGGVLVGRCPLPGHDEKTPSFTIWPGEAAGKLTWKCFGCDAWGDVIDLCQLVEDHAEMWTAMISLAERYSVELPERSEGWKEGAERTTDYRDAALRVLGGVLCRRLYRIVVLPGVNLLADEAARTAELERTWREWQRELPWHVYAEQVLSGDMSLLVAFEKACSSGSSAGEEVTSG